jgi:hypothetical protein
VLLQFLQAGSEASPMQALEMAIAAKKPKAFQKMA